MRRWPFMAQIVQFPINMSETLSPRDEAQLNLLSLSHNFVAALWAVVALFPVAYLSTGMEIITGRFGGAPELSRSFGWSVILWSAASIVLGLTVAVLTFIAGWRLRRRQARSFCLTIAAINCFFFPFGTVLGILTITVLKRPTVREAFRTRPPLANVAAWEDTKLP
jgi:hypothetical protein